MTNKLETMGFQSEVKELLQLMIHSLYSNKEIFLRELISNSADAADKLRYAALKDGSLLSQDGDLKIQIKLDPQNHTLTLIDNAIGMDKEDIVNNLGIIARSGTKEFIKQLGEKSKDSNLIGQFGVGFYSSFIVAKKVEVYSLKAGLPSDQGVYWSSEGQGDFQVGTTNVAKRGTTIILHLKEDSYDYASEWTIRNIVKTYSNHISIPIELEVVKTDSETKEETRSFEVINDPRALWRVPKNELTEEDYTNFYNENFAAMDQPLTWTHNHLEGDLEYTSLLYVPNKAAVDLFQNQKEHGIKLYVQRVFIMDKSDTFLQPYLRFVRGVLDTNSLPLNVSREILQDSKIVNKLKNALTKRVLSNLESLSEDKEKYQEFWDQFGNVLKEGLMDYSNSERIQELFRFASSFNNSSVQNVSFKDYLERAAKSPEVAEGETAEPQTIYYLTASNYQAAYNSPQLDWFKKNNVEVLLLTDLIDEWAVDFFKLDKVKFQDISKTDYQLPKSNNPVEAEQEEIETLIEPAVLEALKAHYGSLVNDVKTTNRLFDTPSLLTTDQRMGTQMAKMFAAMGQDVPDVKYTLLLNPHHKLVRALDPNNQESFADYADLILDQAMLTEKGTLTNPIKFINLINKLL